MATLAPKLPPIFFLLRRAAQRGGGGGWRKWSSVWPLVRRKKRREKSAGKGRTFSRLSSQKSERCYGSFLPSFFLSLSLFLLNFLPLLYNKSFFPPTCVTLSPLPIFSPFFFCLSRKFLGSLFSISLMRLPHSLLRVLWNVNSYSICMQLLLLLLLLSSSSSPLPLPPPPPPP